MSLLEERFLSLRGKSFIPFIVAGDPDLDTTSELLRALSRLHPLAIEVGVPFSDPTADGTVIQRSAQRALRNGVTLSAILQMLRRIRARELAPLVLFSYFNPILQLGIETFAGRAASCGLAGVLVVDLPAEAATALHEQLRSRSIDLIFLVAPTTSSARIAQIVRRAGGFIYAVSRTGVTGSSGQQEDESRRLVRRIRAATKLPVAVGFGITDRAQARRVCRYADAAVVGSRLVAEIEEATAGKDRGNIVRRVVECARQFSSRARSSAD